MITCNFLELTGSVQVTGAKNKKVAREAAITFAQVHGMAKNLTMDDGWMNKWDCVTPKPAGWKNSYIFRPIDKYSAVPPGVTDSATCPHTRKHPDHKYCLDCGSIC